MYAACEVACEETPALLDIACLGETCNDILSLAIQTQAVR